MILAFGNHILSVTDMSYKKIRLLEQEEKEYFLDCVDELYNTIHQDNSYEVSRQRIKFSRQKDRLVRVLRKFTFLNRFPIRYRSEPVINFAALISGDFKVFLPYAFFSRRNFIYMYDAWPRFHKWIFPLLDFLNINVVFFSSKQVYLDHRRNYPKSRCKSMWIPEGIDPAAYHFESFENKTIDVLEFGRIYEAYHNLITGPLQAASKKHVYRSVGMPLLFPDRQSFLQGLAQAKVVVCVPSNITHPDRAEYISTMTLRYLQAMASKVLIVGIMPSDMQELFPYLPIVEIEMDRAAEQLLEVLDDYSRYVPLIERNYTEVWQNQHWKNRWVIMKRAMEEVHE